MKQSTIRRTALTAVVAFTVLAATMALLAPATTGTVAAQSDGTANDSANGTATLEYNDQTVENQSVVVEEANLSNGGYVAIFDEGGNLVGHSDYLESGEQTNVTVSLNDSFTGDQVTIATAYTDDGDEAFNESADAPYRENGAPISSTAYVTSDGTSGETTTSAGDETTTEDGESSEETTTESSETAEDDGADEATEDGETSTDGPGFGVVVALVGLLGAVAVALRRV
ncbi:DUF7282 domain-containing protein [Haloprofundus halophilus]|uniref:DUF7282 domain-containing protein n=1 Tax=Haloprofundus halophilus TaxID=2283527 RepID=UPI0013009800|nr:PGF-CTERM sorting domain-containing protein [Haloprofundus halophilus]